MIDWTEDEDIMFQYCLRGFPDATGELYIVSIVSMLMPRRIAGRGTTEIVARCFVVTSRGFTESLMVFCVLETAR